MRQIVRFVPEYDGFNQEMPREEQDLRSSATAHGRVLIRKLHRRVWLYVALHRAASAYVLAVSSRAYPFTCFAAMTVLDFFGSFLLPLNKQPLF